MKRKFLVLPAILLAFVLFGCEQVSSAKSAISKGTDTDVFLTYVGKTTADNQTVTIRILQDSEALIPTSKIETIAAAFSSTGNPYTISIGNVVKSQGRVTRTNNTLDFTVASTNGQNYRFSAESKDARGGTIEFTTGSFIQNDGTSVSVGEFSVEGLPFPDNPITIPDGTPPEDNTDPEDNNDPPADTNPPINEETVLPPSYLLLDDDTKVDLIANDITALSSSDSATITIGGVQTLDKLAIKQAVFGHAFNNVTTIPDNFLYGFTSLKSVDLSGFTSLATIGNSFLAKCYDFDSPITIPASVSRVGTEFLFECESMQSFVTINCSASAFTASPNSFATTNDGAPMVKQGIKLYGIDETIAAIKDKFPSADDPDDLSKATPPYRVLYGLTMPPAKEYPNPPNQMDPSNVFTSYLKYQTGTKYLYEDGYVVDWAYPTYETLYFTPATREQFGDAYVFYANNNVIDLKDVAIMGEDGKPRRDDDGNYITKSVGVPKDQVVKIVFGENFDGIQSINRDNFLARFEKLTELDLGGFTDLLELGFNFMDGCKSFNDDLELPDSLGNIHSGFMNNCTSFNKPITIPESVFQIGDDFMVNCPAFNSPLNLPASQYFISIGKNFLKGASFFNQPIVFSPTGKIRMIGDNFMDSCSKFNRELILPATLRIVGKDILKNNDAMVSTVTINCAWQIFYYADTVSYSFVTSKSNAASYTHGIQIAGPVAADILTIFPNSTTAPRYRKLINVN